MIENKIIHEVVRRLIDVYHPIEIYLFGSYAWGLPTDESDLDFLVIVEHSEEKHYTRPVAGLLALFGLNISKDLIISTRDEFARNAADKTSLYFKIKHDGKRIYGNLS